MEDQADPTVRRERTTSHSRSSAPRVRLSCEACRQRKVKCDKLSPCTSCVRLGFVCVPVERARLPRGRTRKPPERAASSDKELADRVAKLEQLLRRVAAERDAGAAVEAAPSAGPSLGAGMEAELKTEHTFETRMADVEKWRDQNSQANTGPTMALSHRPRPSASYLGSSFWEDIMQQTSELRNVLDDRLEIEDEIRRPSDFGTSIIGSESSESASNSPQSYRGISITPQARRSLCEIYLRNVDPVFKLLHRPSLRAYLRDDQRYLDYEPDHQAPVTLSYAVYYAAVVTIDDAQCQLLFGLDKKTASTSLQAETEAALQKADFVTTNELTVLQAYVLSLLAARCQDQSRRVWTMSAMALRVGQALCLHMRDPPFEVNPFEQEMRRRCWQCIGLLDFSASLDRASEPMMQSAWLDSHPPSNINDEDIWFDMQVPIQEPPEGTFTDLTLTLIVAAAQSVARMIAYADFIELAVKEMSLRQQVLLDFQRNVTKLLSGCRPEMSAFQLYTKRTAATIYGWLQLGCLRPISRSRNFTPPTVQGDVLLSLAVDNLAKVQESYSDPNTAQWMWFGSLWVPWHGLAVALAELCVCKDPQAMAKHWPVIEQVYHRSSLTIADSQHGMLWKPLEKLMTQARAHKREMLGSTSPNEAAIRQIPLRVMPPPPLRSVPEEMPTPPAASYPLGLEPSLVTGQLDAGASMPPNVMLEPWPNVWDSMDLTGTGLQGSGDNLAWTNYENFIGDVYDSVDTMFLSR
ncbi:hypothetical protein N7532_008651 [Penicillium argentinense]|uniref:Zn(2)-C6 fungal-type domain-containing protein n=1 Tax=Penicillium argentinense TaxID=1131581 RepID=A0A9W9EXT4_9EURO|nr:uncharacterized protein N7532_008651 [Penicillium argentinense]KAJ5089967.1 hypothetical protein N7532_008651 [Penicillium argentinense]